MKHHPVRSAVLTRQGLLWRWRGKVRRPRSIQGRVRCERSARRTHPTKVERLAHPSSWPPRAQTTAHPPGAVFHVKHRSVDPPRKQLQPILRTTTDPSPTALHHPVDNFRQNVDGHAQGTPFHRWITLGTTRRARRHPDGGGGSGSGLLVPRWAFPLSRLVPPPDPLVSHEDSAGRTTASGRRSMLPRLQRRRRPFVDPDALEPRDLMRCNGSAEGSAHETRTA